VTLATVALPVLEFAPLTVVVNEPQLFWVANHIRVCQPVRGGWPAVRMLIGSVDGDQWPWTRIEMDTEEIYRWVQVLGTPESMTVEIGGGEYAFRIGRAHVSPGAPVVLPLECQWWVSCAMFDYIEILYNRQRCRSGLGYRPNQLRANLREGRPTR
jgi:hypothetical protein